MHRFIIIQSVQTDRREMTTTIDAARPISATDSRLRTATTQFLCNFRQCCRISVHSIHTHRTSLRCRRSAASGRYSTEVGGGRSGRCPLCLLMLRSSKSKSKSFFKLKIESNLNRISVHPVKRFVHWSIGSLIDFWRCRASMDRPHTAARAVVGN